MKKYFISFCYEGLYRSGFANISKTSLKKEVTREMISSWEKEIKSSNPAIQRVDILFFKEIK